jgi:hypothetical protein
MVGNSAASWGALVKGSATSGVGTYVREHGNGTYTVTHVFWA